MNTINEKKKAITAISEGKNKEFFKSLPFGFLQIFAEGDADGDGDNNDGDKDGDQDSSQSNSDKDNSNSNKDGESSSDENLKNNKSKTFTQDEVNAIAAKEAKKAQEAFLKKLGVKDFSSAKEGLDKFKEIQDSNKTDAEKQAATLKLLEEEKETYTSENSKLKAQVSAMKAGVKPDSIDDVVILANNLISDDTDMDKAIAKVLKRYPSFKVDAEENDDDGSNKNKKPKFSNGDHKNEDKQSDSDKWKAAFNWNG